VEARNNRVRRVTRIAPPARVETSEAEACTLLSLSATKRHAVKTTDTLDTPVAYWLSYHIEGRSGSCANNCAGWWPSCCAERRREEVGAFHRTQAIGGRSVGCNELGEVVVAIELKLSAWETGSC
jgi:hypothetical protein